MAVELGRSSIEKIITPEAVEFSPLVIGILTLSIGMKIYMFFFNVRFGKKLCSAALRAAGIDSLGDSVATTVVLLSMLVSHFTNVNIDGWCGILVSLFIFYAGINAARETIHPLLGQAPDPELIDQIEAIVMEKEQIVGFHDLVVHDYGPGRLMVSLHGEVPGNQDIYELHDVIDQVEEELREKLGCEAVIHMDPIAVDDEAVFSMRARLAAQVKELGEDVTIHDFRMVQGPTHTNLIFDAVIPYELNLSEAEAKARIQKIVLQNGDHYFAVVKIDRPYVQKHKQY